VEDTHSYDDIHSYDESSEKSLCVLNLKLLEMTPSTVKAKTCWSNYVDRIFAYSVFLKIYVGAYFTHGTAVITD